MLKRSNLNPHSRLYHLEPIGVGTQEVESLTGYLIRLAKAHCVQPGRLIARELAPRMNKTTILAPGNLYISGAFGLSSRGINAAGQMAREWVEVLEVLTKRQELQYLTMLQWENVLRNNLVRRTKAWCPACYGEDRLKDKEVYERLIWALDVVTLCPRHKRTLRTRCNFCGKHLPMIGPRARPGYCSRCDEWLGLTSRITAIEDERLHGEEFKWQSWVADQVGALLVAATQLSTTPQRENFAASVSEYYETLARGDKSVFAQKINLGSVALFNWRKGIGLPQLKNLLRFSHYVGAAVKDILTGNLAINQLQTGRIRSSKISRQDLRADELHQIELRLQSALEEHPPPSKPEMVRRTGRAWVTIQKHFPELCQKIQDRLSKHNDKTPELEKLKSRLLLYSEELPPPSLNTCMKRLGRKYCTLWLYFPELCRVIVARHHEFQEALCRKRKEQRREAIRNITLTLQGEGIRPSFNRILARLHREPYGIKISRRELSQLLLDG